MQATKIPERIIHNDNWRIFMPDLVRSGGRAFVGVVGVKLCQPVVYL